MNESRNLPDHPGALDGFDVALRVLEGAEQRLVALRVYDAELDRIERGEAKLGEKKVLPSGIWT